MHTFEKVCTNLPPYVVRARADNYGRREQQLISVIKGSRMAVRGVTSCCEVKSRVVAAGEVMDVRGWPARRTP